ncbi:hypothetical protein RJT34_32983 [Clitoria ternatea]|uniref:Uncharacterized protein n=1 Tax=Clitoria ternatea TaxID=43366 RepID=A0AAN9EX17_CLITE
MDWWHKIRTTWTSLSTRIKLRKSCRNHFSYSLSINHSFNIHLILFYIAAGITGGRGAGGGAGGGLLKLRDDVQMCGYRDVEVMWNMLSISLEDGHQIDAATRGSNKSKLHKRCYKHKSISRLFFWISHNPELN